MRIVEFEMNGRCGSSPTPSRTLRVLPDPCEIIGKSSQHVDVQTGPTPREAVEILPSLARGSLLSHSTLRQRSLLKSHARTMIDSAHVRAALHEFLK